MLSAIALFLFGGEVLRGFSFAMIVGIITGTYSSVFVAAAIVTFWNRGRSRAVTADATSATATQPPTRRTKSQRKAKAS
jgi:preprotein translocase subunit SecF